MIRNAEIIWHCREKKICCAEKTLIMGILNATPDSFSDGGTFQPLEKAVERSLEMVGDGADIIDIGGESTRPGAEPVQALEEIERTIPIIGKLRVQTNALISIDTQKADVARAAIDAGADIINDVSALGDPEMAAVAAETGAGLIMMHMQGSPVTMQTNPQYADAVSEVRNFLESRALFAMKHGVSPRQIALDPGIGFGKTDEHNIALLREIPKLVAIGCPVLIGVSRKSLIGRLLGREIDDRLAGSLSAALFAVMRGAHILRVHDVKESCDAVNFLNILQNYELAK